MRCACQAALEWTVKVCDYRALGSLSLYLCTWVAPCKRSLCDNRQPNASFKVPSRKARAPSSLPMSFLRLAELLVMSAVSYVSTRWFESGRLQAWLSCLFSETSKREQRDRNRKRWDERERRGVISPYKVFYFVESCSLVFLLLFPSLSPASSGAGLRATFPFPGQGQRHISSSRARPKPCASRPLQSTWLVLPDQAC